MTNLILKIINFYQKFLSPDTGFLRFLKTTKTCRFYPSCSEYMVLAIKKHGLFRGVIKGFNRLLRCNPFNPGGYDPIK
ncbi:MAG TPA: membrane protein insertion efficiency factor YidD [bacterium]|nr:membrane protein insertion efficiency factor YidD [bacterium]HPL95710.1 membrane protein insertion efficiency factor YidD [bacterium]